MKKLLIILSVMFILSGCNVVISENTNTDQSVDYISSNDTDASYSLNGSTYITLGNEDININKAGTYILNGELNGSIIVEVSDQQKVQLVLDGVTINSDDFAGIYVVEADEVTITVNENTVNTINDSKQYTQIDSNEVDALIYSKADLVINGKGTLNLNSDYNHGIVSKDDLVLSDVTINEDVAGQGLRGKDCVKIASGTYNITSLKDAIKSDNDEDSSRGYVYIASGTFNINSGSDGIYGLNLVTIEGGDFVINTNMDSSSTSAKAIKSDKVVKIEDGSFNINASDDGIHSDQNILISAGDFTIVSSDDAIHGDELVQIDGGTFNIEAREGIEATYVLVNDGNININGIDDGINAGQKSNAYTATIEINGGNITVVMAQGDTDAIDSNGNIYINGGTIDITAQSGFDYDGTAQLNGGTVIINGTQVDSITNQMFGGMGGGQMFGGFGGPGR